MIGHIGDIHVARFIKPDFMWQVESGGHGRAAVACVSGFPCPCNDYRLPRFQIQPANRMVQILAKIDVAIGPDNDAEGIVDQRIAEAFLARSGNGVNLSKFRRRMQQSSANEYGENPFHQLRSLTQAAQGLGDLGHGCLLHFEDRDRGPARRPDRRIGRAE